MRVYKRLCKNIGCMMRVYVPAGDSNACGYDAERPHDMEQPARTNDAKR